MCIIESYTENQHLNQCGISRRNPGGDDAWAGVLNTDPKLEFFSKCKHVCIVDVNLR